MAKRFSLILSIFFTLQSCNFLGQQAKSGLSWLALLSLGGVNTSSSELPAAIDASSSPSASYEASNSSSTVSSSSNFSVSKSETPLPSSLENTYVPVGKVYDVDLNWNQISGVTNANFDSIQLNENVELKYSYDPSKLVEGGFIEEFVVFYYDKLSDEWKPLTNVRVDTEKHEIVAITDHFTPFVLTALPSPSGTGIANAPSCITSEAPISGSGSARWTTIDANFKYYLDRNYTIIQDGDFNLLGFDSSLGIATCNGGTPNAGYDSCGTFANHKNFNGTNYIQFTAPKDVNVYVMYDSRGPSDAPWLASNGWTDTGLKIKTTDAVGVYKVYTKNFSQGQLVSINGNWNGITGPTNINTNLWLVVKPTADKFGIPSDVCSNGAVSFSKVDATHGIPGSDRNTLFWELPANANITNVVIRKQLDHPTLSPAGGMGVSGTEYGQNVFTDTGLTVNTTYYYSIFAVNAAGEYSAPKVIELTTGLDTDLDGIKDGYELNPDITYYQNQPTLYNQADSDGDGNSDLQEIIEGTDPRNSDSEKPVIQSFTLTSETPTQTPIAIFQLNATDNKAITHWILREGNQRPRYNDPAWKTEKPDFFSLSEVKNYSYSIWAKDEAGNISEPYTPVTVNLTGLKYPKFVFSSFVNANTIKSYRYNLFTKSLELVSSLTLTVNIKDLTIHPSNKFLIATHPLGFKIVSIDANSGILKLKGSQSLDVPVNVKFDATGDYFYAISRSGTDNLQSYQVDAANETLTAKSQYYLGAAESIRDFYLDPFKRYIWFSNDHYGFCDVASYNLSNGVVGSFINFVSTVSASGCYYGIVTNSSKYLYTIDHQTNVRTYQNMGNGSLSYVGDMYYGFDNYPAAYFRLASHPVRDLVYMVRRANADVFIQTLVINKLGGSNGVLDASGDPSYFVYNGLGGTDRAQMDKTGQLLLLASGDGNLFTINIDSQTSLPSSHSRTLNAGTRFESLSIYDSNEPLELKIKPSQSKIFQLDKIGRPMNQPIFDTNEVCILNDSPNYIKSSICTGSLEIFDYDHNRCQSNNQDITTSVSVTTPVTNWIYSLPFFTSQTDLRKMFAYYSFTPASTGLHALNVSATDSPGTCLGSALTTSRSFQIPVKRLVIGDPTEIAGGTPLQPDPYTRFVVESSYGFPSRTQATRSCKIDWNECIKLSRTNLQCEIKSGTFAIPVAYKQSRKKNIAGVYTYGYETCSRVWRDPLPTNKVLFLIKTQDLGLTITHYWRGRWFSLVD